MRYFKSSFNVFLNYRHLLMNLVSRDIKVKYRRSVLGILWSVLNPLLMVTVMYFVFGTLFKQILNPNDLPSVSATGQPPSFLLYLISGQLIFTFFNEATNAAMDSVYGNAGLIKKVYIPKYIFPFEKVLFSFVNTLFSSVSLIFVIIITGSPLTLWALLAPLVLIMLFIFNLGVGLVLSSAVVFFRDIKHLYAVFVLALTYMTPIFYPEAIFGDNKLVATVVRFNPIYWYLSMFRQFVVYGRAPTVYQCVATIGCSLVAIVLGLSIFRKVQDDFILHI